MAIGSEIVVALVVPSIMAISRAVSAIFIAWLKKKGSDIEIRIGSRVVGSINTNNLDGNITAVIQNVLRTDMQKARDEGPTIP